MSHTRMATLAFILSDFFPLIVSDAISCLLHNLKNPLVYYHDTLQLCRTHLHNVLGTRMATLTFIVSELFPLIFSDAIFDPLHNLKTLWYFIMIFYSYVEHILIMCLVQE